jgi:hypothetical protein
VYVSSGTLQKKFCDILAALLRMDRQSCGIMMPNGMRAMSPSEFGTILAQLNVGFWNVARLMLPSWNVFSKSKVKQSRYRLAGDKRERKYRSYSFLTSALDGGEWSASRPERALPLGKGTLYQLDRRLNGSQSQSEHRD